MSESAMRIPITRSNYNLASAAILGFNCIHPYASWYQQRADLPNDLCAAYEMVLSVAHAYVCSEPPIAREITNGRFLAAIALLNAPKEIEGQTS